MAVRGTLSALALALAAKGSSPTWLPAASAAGARRTLAGRAKPVPHWVMRRAVSPSRPSGTGLRGARVLED